MGTKVEYSCDDCGITIPGESGDPQEGPVLYCPDCGERMEYTMFSWENGTDDN